MTDKNNKTSEPTIRDVDGDGTTDFGFKRINAEEKVAAVKSIFSGVASQYDLMNDVMSFGVHRLWKRQFVREIGYGPDMTMLDVAGGTGDISFGVFDSVKGHMLPGAITVCDINPEMLAEGKKRAVNRGILKPLQWVVGNAECLPFPNNSFDRYTIAFGLRNVTDKVAAIRDAYRVLKPGGKFLCLEFSHVDTPIVRKLYETYSFNIIPKMGKMVAANEDAYQYLVESIKQFPDQETLKAQMAEVGFEEVYYKNLSFGVAAIHVGVKG